MRERFLFKRFMEAYRAFRRCLEQAGFECAQSDTRILFEWAGVPIQRILASPGEVLSREQADRLHYALEKRLTHMPVQYITQEAYFMGYRFAVAPGVLIPRPETEILVQQARACLSSGFRMLDLCCGSGCIGISAHLLYGVQVVCADISEVCVRVTRDNITQHGCTEHVRVCSSDLFDGLKEQRFDVIACNPPYIPHSGIQGLMKDVSAYEPHTALDGGVDGLDYYRALAHEISAFLTPRGHVLLEVGCDQAQSVAALFENGFSSIDIYKDLSGIDRVVHLSGGKGH
jgi:release factor glutamine methyltransferase